LRCRITGPNKLVDESDVLPARLKPLVGLGKYRYNQNKTKIAINRPRDKKALLSKKQAIVRKKHFFLQMIYGRPLTAKLMAEVRS